MYSFIHSLTRLAEAAKRTWRSPIYSFFKNDVVISHEGGRLFHFFPCAARRCKNDAGGVRRYQDKTDKHSTGNLRHHAIRCFGEDAVRAATENKSFSGENGSIFQAFARQGQEPVTMSHRSLTNPEARALLVKWVTESNRPTRIVKDRDFVKIITAGRPHLAVPSPATVSRDIEAVFEGSRDKIKTLLQDHPGRLHFATDAWTSPNHQAFVAWTVHLEHDGHMLAFLLDVVEVPESHTGATLAKVFQAVLVDFGIQHKVLSVVADNASSNDTQVSRLSSLDNTFDEEARVRCFNHTLSLASKALLAPFNPALGGADAVEDIADAESVVLDDDDDDCDNQSDEDEENVDDDIDELNALDALSKEDLMAETLIARDVVTKVSSDHCLLFTELTCPIDPESIVCHCSFEYHCLTCVVAHLR